MRKRKVFPLIELLVFVPLLFLYLNQAAVMQAQEFKLLDREIQVHGWLSQGFVYTNQNNWLTMNTSSGSGAMTDMGLNASTQLTDKFRVGAQVYDRSLGQLGQWHPSLDWAVADYRFTSWFGIRGGKVKTVFGLYNDTQDQDFLHTFALLPQSVYPTDLRDATIAHLGGDVYGNVPLPRRLGDLDYTVFAGHRSDSPHSGYAFLVTQYGVLHAAYSALQFGADLRWNTPLKGLLIGASRINEDVTGKATFVNPLDPGAGLVPFSEVSKSDGISQFYGEYVVRKLRIDSEYRRFQHHGILNQGLIETVDDVRGWYVSAVYPIRKWLELGSYYSRYTITAVPVGGLLAAVTPPETDTSLPANHVYDKVITARVDLNKFWTIKVEGHFMDGYGASSYPNGFYPQVNPNGFQPNTNALIIKTSIHF